MSQVPESEQWPLLGSDTEALRASFLAVASQPRAFAEVFYARLFELAPGVRSLFPVDLQAQQEKFAQTLTTVVSFVDQPLVLLNGLRQLGARHTAYGAQAMHYAVVGEALLHSLETCSGTALTAPARQAWRRLYGWIVAEMLSGAQAGAPSNLGQSPPS